MPKVLISEYWIQDNGGVVRVYKNGSAYELIAVEDDETVFLHSKNISTLIEAENRAEEIALLVQIKSETIVEKKVRKGLAIVSPFYYIKYVRERKKESQT